MKVAVIVLADTETHEDLARVVNGMVALLECKEAGDQTTLIFDGAGTRRPAELDKPDHRAHELWEKVRDQVAGACDYCAEAFESTHAVQDAGVKLLDEYRRHPSIRSLLADGYHVLTF